MGARRALQGLEAAVWSPECLIVFSRTGDKGLCSKDSQTTTFPLPEVMCSTEMLNTACVCMFVCILVCVSTYM